MIDTRRPDEPHLDFLRRIADVLPSMLAYWDAGLICRYANDAYQDWFGVPPGALPGSSLRDLLGPQLFALNEPHIRAALRGEAQVFERLIPRPDGSMRPALAHYVPDVVDGVVRGFGVEVIDTTSVKPAWAASLVADHASQDIESRAQHAVARAVSERTRNALNAILGLGYLLRQEPALQPRHAHWVDGILESGRVIETLLREIEGPLRDPFGVPAEAAVRTTRGSGPSQSGD